MKKFAEYVGVATIALFVISVVAMIVALPVKMMVNYLFTQSLLASIFGTPRISFWQAFWLSILCSFLFEHGKSKDK